MFFAGPREPYNENTDLNGIPILTCKPKHVLAYALVFFFNYSSGIIALIICYKIRSIPENFHDVKAIFMCISTSLMEFIIFSLFYGLSKEIFLRYGKNFILSRNLFNLISQVLFTLVYN